MRDRLIELIKPHISGTACLLESGSCELTNCRECKARRFADHLIENGVILSPCKVGDTVYEINTAFPNSPYINRFVVVALHITSGKNILGHKKPSHAVVMKDDVPSLTKRIYLEKFGKTVFLTKEEAEKALRGEGE